MKTKLNRLLDLLVVIAMLGSFFALKAGDVDEDIDMTECNLYAGQASEHSLIAYNSITEGREIDAYNHYKQSSVLTNMYIKCVDEKVKEYRRATFKRRH